MQALTDTPPTFFIARSSAIQGRLDPEMVLFLRQAQQFAYPVYQLKDLLVEPPQYGANESSIVRTSIDQPRYVRITDIAEDGTLSQDLGATLAVTEKKYMLRDNDLLIARSGNTVGKSYLHRTESNPNPCYFAGYLLRFRFDLNLVIPEFVFTYTQLPIYKRWVQAMQRRAGQPNINAQEYASLQIPLPPLNVQQKIVDQLRSAYDEKRNFQVKARRLLSAPFLLQILGLQSEAEVHEDTIFLNKWSQISGKRFDPTANHPKVVNLRKVLENGKYKARELKSVVYFCRSTVNSISPKEIYIGMENVDGDTGLGIQSNDKESVSAALRFTSQDVLFPKLRPYLNKTYFPGFDGLCSTEFHVLRAHEVSSEYLCSVLRCAPMVALTSTIVTGNTLPRLQLTDVETLPIPIPPIEIQDEISRKLCTLRSRGREILAKAAQEFDDQKNRIQ
ncbi:MAG: restriction endonuclease subunit S, partial [Sphingobacteriales bacterium]